MTPLPRSHSACCPSECPNSVTHPQVAFSVVSFQTRYGTRRGVATTWLQSLVAPMLAAAGDGAGAPPPAVATPLRLPIFLKRADVFKPPADLSGPLIMVRACVVRACVRMYT